MAKSKKSIKSKSSPHKKTPAKKKTSQKRAPTSIKKTLANRNTAKTATRVPQTKKSAPTPASLVRDQGYDVARLQKVPQQGKK